MKAANKDRAERAQQAMETYLSFLYPDCNSEDIASHDENIIDLITDLLHLHNASENRTRAILEMAKMNYISER